MVDPLPLGGEHRDPRDSGALRCPRPGGHPLVPVGSSPSVRQVPAGQRGAIVPRDSAPRTVGERAPEVPPGATGPWGRQVTTTVALPTLHAVLVLSGNNPTTQHGELHEDGRRQAGRSPPPRRTAPPRLEAPTTAGAAQPPGGRRSHAARGSTATTGFSGPATDNDRESSCSVGRPRRADR